jgi:hypothetical protein
VALITNYSSLKGEVANWLNRSDLTDAIETMIQLAEKSLNEDHRVRSLVTNNAFVVDADDEALPSDCAYPESLYHDGATYFGEIEIVPAEKLGGLKAVHGTTGVPAYAALQNNALKFAPVPSGSFTLKLTYWRQVPALSSSAPTNWLITDHPHIYLYATLVESAPYLKDDDRLQVWRQELELRLERLHDYLQRRQFSGSISRRPRRPIG